MPLAISSISVAVYPKAYKPPTTLPILVPTMKSGFMPRSSNTFSTPIWAMPNAPPPLKTSPIVGLVLGLTNEESVDWAVTVKCGINVNNVANTVTKSVFLYVIETLIQSQKNFCRF